MHHSMNQKSLLLFTLQSMFQISTLNLNYFSRGGVGEVMMGCMKCEELGQYFTLGSRNKHVDRTIVLQNHEG